MKSLLLFIAKTIVIIAVFFGGVMVGAVGTAYEIEMAASRSSTPQEFFSELNKQMELGRNFGVGPYRYSGPPQRGTMDPYTNHTRE